MRHLRVIALSIAILAAASGSARADDTATGCAKFKWSIAREQAAFSEPGLAVLSSGAALPATAASVSLRPQTQVSFVEPPARKPKADPAFAAILTLPPIAAAETYEVTLSDEAWIDVVQNGKDVRAAAFSGQPDCPGVRKSVRFVMQPGPATVQISGSATQTIKIGVLPAQ